ncbi:hypothetical protein RHGRI_004821 [Rhododendron griersonianum]|uniref:PSP proline-rich domain-containing protein n=1 Tax=Rhododendron griersonianum TaxID=479676 RepID=A0AAV6LC70_9ERIC|nr:hypothetical protein RHGRI_004821 [Rhododendron griersonianum]
MTAEVANGVAEPLSYPNGGIMHQNPSNAAVKKWRETERRRQRKRKKKNNKASQQQRQPSVAADDSDEDSVHDNDSAKENGDPLKVIQQVEVEYVPEKQNYMVILMRSSGRSLRNSVLRDLWNLSAASKKKVDSDSEEEEQDAQQKDKGVSNKKKKLQRRMKIAELKQISTKPDVVEGKRGIEKQPFQLPDFIAATEWDFQLSVELNLYTCQLSVELDSLYLPIYPWLHNLMSLLIGILQAYIEKEDSKKLKQKQRERMQPRMGKMDIDYQVLHDTFFKYQTKPKLTAHGDLYHEGKEFEVKLREMKPGMLSQELKEALGMPEGAPPPWLINMQIS